MPHDDAIKKLSEKYGFDEEEAKSFLNAYENGENTDTNKEVVEENKEEVVKEDEKPTETTTEEKVESEEKVEETTEEEKVEEQPNSTVLVEKPTETKINYDDFTKQNKEFNERLSSLNARLDRIDEFINGLTKVETDDVGLRHDLSPTKPDDKCYDPVKKALEKANSY